MKNLDTRPTALSAFLTTLAEVEAKLDRLKAHASDHFGTNPDAISWADVGSLNAINTRLREVSDFAFGEGDCAG